jgi:signal transduction histidine kinase
VDLGVTPHTAKLLSRAILVAVVAMLALSFALMFVAGDRAGTDHVVVVGDPNAPGMAEVQAQLLRDAQPGDRFGEISTGDVVFSLIAATIAVAWAITGALIVSRQPRNSAGWIFCIGAVSITLNVSALVYVVYSVRIASKPLPGQDFVALIGEYSFALVALIPLLVLLFPDGRPPSPRWRWATWTLLIGFGLSVVAFALTPGPLNNLVEDGILYANPFGLSLFAEGRPANALVGIGVFMMLGASLATVVAAWQRFRRARGEERQQMRWLVATATLAGIGIGAILLLFPVSLLLGTSDEGPEWLWAVLFLPTALAIFVGIPAAYLVAIFKHGLWDLDVVIKKALVALVLTLLIAGVGVVAIGVLGRSALWEGDRTGAVIGILAGLAIWPLVGFSRRIAKRVVFGKRAAPYQVLTEFSGRVGGTYATEDVLPRMAQILGQGAGAEHARVWLHVGGTLRPEAAWPANAAAREPVPLAGDELPTIDGESAFEVRDRGELLGALSVVMPANDPMNPSKDRLVRDLASQAGLVLRNVRLIEELRASRQRLVAAQDEERRKLERDLHDGAQQQLVALAVQLKLARTMIERDPAKADDMLETLQASAADALEDLRDLARGIFPPLLADQGLAAAIDAQARKSSVPTTVRSDGLGRYPREVEAAVYFSCLEALNNVAKYAQASNVGVRLEQGNGTLTFEVHDDGVGFDPATKSRGTGLQGMADRIDAVGGRLEISAAAGKGTTIRGRIPTERGVA